jgi:hypothetical protein
METYQYIFLKLASGNQADSSCFGKIAVECQKQLKVNSVNAFLHCICFFLCSLGFFLSVISPCDSLGCGIWVVNPIF